MSEPVFTRVTAVENMPEKNFSTYNIGGKAIVVGRFQEEYFAIENRCSHALSSFDEGRLRGYRITCPLHGAAFDIRDGSCIGAPATKPIRSLPLRIRDGLIEVDLSSLD